MVDIRSITYIQIINQSILSWLPALLMMMEEYCWHFTFQLKQNKHASTCKYLILLWYFADLNQQAIHATWAKLQEFIICRYRKVYIAMLNYLNNMADVYKCWYILYHCADTTTMAKCKKAEYCTLSIYIQGLILHTSNLPTLRIDWNS